MVTMIRKKLDFYLPMQSVLITPLKFASLIPVYDDIHWIQLHDKNIYLCFYKIKGKQFYSYIMYLEQVTYQWDNEEIYFVLDQHAKLDFYSASSLKQQSVNIGHSSQTYYADFKPNSFCSYSLMLHAQHKSNKYQCKSLVWPDQPPDQGPNSRSTTLEVSTLTITPPMWFALFKKIPINENLIRLT